MTAMQDKAGSVHDQGKFDVHDGRTFTETNQQQVAVAERERVGVWRLNGCDELDLAKESSEQVY